jgi:ATP-dependent helicase/nuclease subunit A
VTPPSPPDQAVRHRLRTDLDTTFLVEAAAGTGKTASLVGRMTELIAQGRCSVETMAAVTFTRKAAAELRARLSSGLETAAGQETGSRRDRLARAVSRSERAFVGTIHSFCARLLRERPVEAGVPIGFRELEEEDDAAIRDQAWGEFTRALYARGDAQVARLGELGVHLTQLRAAFDAFAGYTDVEEWPVPDIRLGDLTPAIEALEMYLKRIRSLLPSLPEDPVTDRLMPRYRAIDRLARHRDVAGRPVHLMEVLEEFDRSHGAVMKHWPGGPGLVKREIETWDTFRREVAAPFLNRWRQVRYTAVIPLLRSAGEFHARLRAERGLLTFQDLLLGAARLLRERAAVRRYFRGRFTHLLVDEFQDTDPLQAEVILYLTADDPAQRDWRCCRPVPGSLFVVGDPKQSIYRFRRADIATYQQVREIILGAGGAVVELDASFRTVPALVAWANGVFAAPTFPAAADRYAPTAHPLRAMRAEPEQGELTGVRVITIPSDRDTNDACASHDARAIARFIRQALDSGLPVPRSPREVEAGVPAAAMPGDFLIVAWRKERLSLYAAALQELGIPHQVSGGSAWRQVEELGLLAGLLRALVEPENQVALAALLRGGLFGFGDDELYLFRRARGSFSYLSPIPDGLPPETAARFQDAFARLRRYAGWFRTAPPSSALARTAADAGLLLRALAAPGGDGRSGSMAKALALLRERNPEPGSAAGLADLLDRLIEEAAPLDGLPARAAGSSLVRVMNLHRVKGLEAPVVFLADPGGQPRMGRLLHVRRGERTTGHLAVEQENQPHGGRLLAHPPDWEALREEEERFETAERVRLLYVAATRAGSLLVVSRRAGARQRQSPWHFFGDWLEGAPELDVPETAPEPTAPGAAVDEPEVASALEEIAARWSRCRAPSHDVRGAKELALSLTELHRRTPAGEHGTEWGTVLHFLLESSLRTPLAHLPTLAESALAEQGLSVTLAPQALAVVEAVRASEVWRRAAASPHSLAEVPLVVALEPGDPLLPGAALPTLVRGVVDLAFREGGAWVILDWKTDAVRDGADLFALARRYEPQVALYASLWSRLTGEQVVERGLYFTAADRYVRL